MNEHLSSVSVPPSKMNVTPYQNPESGKKEQVEQMFDNISGNYDFLNRSLSLGIDVLWRKIMMKQLKDLKNAVILDVATGTADVAIEAASLKPASIIGMDILEGMLSIGRKKGLFAMQKCLLVIDCFKVLT